MLIIILLFCQKSKINVDKLLKVGAYILASNIMYLFWYSEDRIYVE